MPNVEVGTFARVAAVGVETVGRTLINSGLRIDDSLLTPGRPVWTLVNLDELTRDYVERPDAGSGGFFEKLSAQLSDTSPEAIQLFAEILILNMLPITNVGGPLKVKQVREVLALSTSPADLPEDVEAALVGGGVFNGGQAFTSNRWAQIVYLINLAKHFKGLTEPERISALADPKKFRAEVQSVKTGQAAQRQSLMYLAFPHFYLPVVTGKHREKLRDGLSSDYLAAPTGDQDADIAEIYRTIVDEQGAHVDLYKSPWIERWLETTDPRPEKVRHAWRVRGADATGTDLTSRWNIDGTITLSASLLRAEAARATHEDLKEIIDEDYGSLSYAAREVKAEECHAFLNRMKPNDVVATLSEGRVYVGVIRGEAQFVSSDDAETELVRAVDWYPQTHSATDIPADLATRLNAPGDVLDISQFSKVLLALVEELVLEPAVVDLPDATPELAASVHVDVGWINDCIELLRERKQLIFYGPPGTGKTYIAQKLAQHVTDRANIKVVQFHPAYSYEDFFEGFRPKQGAGGQIGFALKAGPLRALVDKAAESPGSAYVLIIDEINRGNLPKIFGELYFLLEYRDEAIDLMYSSDSVEPFSLPKNIFVIGTMNTADRSIALVDAALRRRFAFLPLHPSEAPTNGILRSWLKAKSYSTRLADIHDELNKRIADTDFKIGPSYFMRDKIASDTDGAALNLMWRTDILPLLEEHHYGDRSVNVAAHFALEAVKGAVLEGIADPLAENGFRQSAGDDDARTASNS